MSEPPSPVPDSPAPSAPIGDPMFLSTARSLNLLAPDPDSNIIGNFALPVKKILVNEVVTHLLEKQNGVHLLTSAAHVKWAMETCGQGFTLPIEDEEIISKVINLYRIWLLEPAKRPQPIQNDPQFFIQRILEHYSLLFAQRHHSPQTADRHASLCSKVLDIYANIGMQAGNYLTKETWEIFLKLLISIADSILLKEPPAGLDALQKRLPSQLAKVLFEQFLFSGLQDPFMWNALASRVVGWTRHMALMMTWKVTCFALTKRTLSLIYGGTEGSDSIIIKIDESVHTIPASREFTFYSWHRMFQILGNPNETVQDPAIFLAFMNGVEMLVNQYLKIGMSTKRKSKRNKAPDGNTILHVFGKWLFESILLPGRDAFDEGQALALKTLCTIFTSKETTSFLPTYTARFCMCLQHALMKEGRLLLAAINNSVGLMPQELIGIRSVVPAFVYAINRILTKKVQSFEHIFPTDHVRRACIRLLGQIISLPNHFGHGQFRLRIQDKAAAAYDVKKYNELKPLITAVLTESLTNETAPSNIEALLYMAYTWLVEDTADSSSENLKQYIMLIIRKVTSHVAWPTEVTLCALRTMSSMARLWPSFRIDKEQANFVVVNLCKYVSSQSIPSSRFPGKDTKEIEDLVAQSFRCITDWVLVSQWIFDYPETRFDLLSSLVIGMTGKKQNAPEIVPAAPEPKKEISSSSKKSKKESKGVDKQQKQAEKEKEIPPSPIIRSAAMHCLLHIMNHLGNFPTASGASSVSTLVVEEDIVQDIAALEGIDIVKARQFMRYFITEDKVIIGLIDRPPHGDDDEASTTVVVRDRSGKYAWDVKLTHLPHSEQQVQQPRPEHPDVPVSKDPFERTGQEIAADKLTRIGDFFASRGASRWDDTVSSQVESEEAHLAKYSHFLDYEIAADQPLPAEPYQGDCKLQQSRMLLAHLGYLSLENRARLYPINLSKEFFNQLKMLDQIRERDCVKVGVLYARQGQSDFTEFLGNEGGTLDYQEFLSSLGWGINVATHNGYIAGLDRQLSTGNVAPYWASYSTETVFLATTLMPNVEKSPDHQMKKLLLQHTYVNVVWVENGTNYNPQGMWKLSPKCSVQIVIMPLRSGLYHVRMHVKTGDKVGLGPLLDGLILAKHTLGTLVRETSVSCHLLEKEAQEGSTSQFELRQRSIEDIFLKFKVNTSLGEFYSTLFGKLPDAQVACIGPGSKGHLNLVRRQSRAASRTLSSEKKGYLSSGGASVPEKDASPPGHSKTPSEDRSANGADSFGRVAPKATRPSGTASSGLRMGSRGSNVSVGRTSEDEEEKKKKDKKDKKKT
eukprot:TRINITY_DN4270_c0_g1_i1.p1 TRINITY_DN4270_c0_g1~~TRINITY_DN4270_c0_g1_i1.p1  ORF type:complete len:1309 (-),score=500.74 TRINITY_DN4270_c0_g1_i1:354-4280(-)